MAVLLNTDHLTLLQRETDPQSYRLAERLGALPPVAALRKQRIRISTLDLRIASIALVSDSTLRSRNLRHFRQVPGLKVEDWTQ